MAFQLWWIVVSCWCSVFMLDVTFSAAVPNKPETYHDGHEIESRGVGYKAMFLLVAGSDSAMDETEMQSVATEAYKTELKGKRFNLDACRSIITKGDVNNDGELSYTEFHAVWPILNGFAADFVRYDADKNYELDVKELRKLFIQLKIPRNFDKLLKRFSDFANENGNLNIDRYVQLRILL